MIGLSPLALIFYAVAVVTAGTADRSLVDKRSSTLGTLSTTSTSDSSTCCPGLPSWAYREWCQTTPAIINQIAANALSPSSLTKGVIIPLYIYPAWWVSPGAWDWVYTAASNYPQIAFTVIVNPSSGPGTGALPNSDYQHEITRLSAFSNINLLGYVDTTFGKRAPADVKNDVSVYAGWGATNANLAMDGIYFDNQASGSDYLSIYASYASQVRSNSGFPGGIVGFGPGQVCDPAYVDLADFLVIFEDASTILQSDLFGWYKSFITSLTSTQLQKLSFMLSSADSSTVKAVTNLQAVFNSAYLYVSDSTAQWGAQFQTAPSSAVLSSILDLISKPLTSSAVANIGGAGAGLAICPALVSSSTSSSGTTSTKVTSSSASLATSSTVVTVGGSVSTKLIVPILTTSSTSTTSSVPSSSATFPSSVASSLASTVPTSTTSSSAISSTPTGSSVAPIIAASSSIPSIIVASSSVPTTSMTSPTSTSSITIPAPSTSGSSSLSSSTSTASKSSSTSGSSTTSSSTTSSSTTSSSTTSSSTTSSSTTSSSTTSSSTTISPTATPTTLSSMSSTTRTSTKVSSTTSSAATSTCPANTLATSSYPTSGLSQITSKSYGYYVYPNGFDIGGSAQYPDSTNILYVAYGINSVQACADTCSTYGTCSGSSYVPAYGACYVFDKVPDCGFTRTYSVYTMVRR